MSNACFQSRNSKWTGLSRALDQSCKRLTKKRGCVVLLDARNPYCVERIDVSSSSAMRCCRIDA